MPITRGQKPVTRSKIPKLGKNECQEEGPQVKRVSSPALGAPTKRPAFSDITNAHKVQISLPVKKLTGKLKKPAAPPKAAEAAAPPKAAASISVAARFRATLKKSSSVSSEGASGKAERPKRVVAAAPAEELVAAAPPAGREPPAHLQRPPIPEQFDVDSEHQDDVFMSPEYAKDIFDHLRRREEQFVLVDYMDQQPSLTPGMRAILVDWLVEVQENFELNHETLYLAVKLTDHFLARAPVQREVLQLIGSTAMLVASKFEERNQPCVEDFLYICDDAYKHEEMIAMETRMLQVLDFDISIPISYRFLRRYAKCAGVAMDTLTLARYVCELSLYNMDLVGERGSKMAAACLLVALVTKQLGGWSPLLLFHSGYHVSDLSHLVLKLHSMMSSPPDDKLRAVRSKYSHKVFFEVASLPLVDIDVLQRALAE